MKKILLLLAIFSMVFTSCEPLEEINKELDAEVSAVVGDLTYTLIDEDYTNDIEDGGLGLNFESFNSEEEAKLALPAFLTYKNPVWGKGSSALISYNLYVGRAEGISGYTEADDYSLALSDYPGSLDNAVAFYQNENPSEFLPAILASNIAGSQNGDVVLAKYSQYVGETVNGITEFYNADFETAGTLLDFVTVDILGAQTWEETQSYGAKMTGFSGGSRNANEDWLISTNIDLSAFPNSTIQINQILNFGNYDDMEILISKDYTGNAVTATWEVINLTTVPDGTSWSPVLSEEYSLSAYNGESVNIAFKYTSSDSSAGTWEILQATLKAPGVEGVSQNQEAFYTFNNTSWELAEDVYYLSSADYNSMGEASGQPGRFDNFSSSVSPSDYLPTFLKIKYPFAQEGDALSVIYKYFSGGVQLRGDLYTYTSGAWLGFQSTIVASLQLAHDSNSWVPDNTIKYEFVATDYTLIADTYRSNADYAAAVANLETYGNISTFNWDEDQIDAAVNTVLNEHFPVMEEDQKFAVTIFMYNGSSQNVTTNYILKSGVYIRN